MDKTVLYGQRDDYAHTLPKNTLQLLLAYQAMNDTIDVLKIKRQEFGNITSATSLGDLTGTEATLRFAPLDSVVLSASSSKLNIQYGSGSLNNEKKHFSAKYSFGLPFLVSNAKCGIEGGYISNRGNDLMVSDVTLINDLVGKAFPQYKLVRLVSPKRLSISGSYVDKFGDTVDLNNVPLNLTKDAYVATQSLVDTSYYAKLLLSVVRTSGIDGYHIGYKKTSIDSVIDSSFNHEVASITDKYPAGFSAYKSLKRDEKELSVGATIARQLEKTDFFYEIAYEYKRFLRDNSLNYRDYNHIVDFTLSNAITRKAIVFASARYMQTQLNGEIPYLYNQYSQTSFDHRYGYVKFGTLINF